jgi:chromosomal replication initiator protein
MYERVGKERYNLWLHNTRLLELSGSKAKVGVPNLFVATWLEERLLGELTTAASEVLGKHVAIHFAVDGTLYRRMKRRTTRQVQEFERKAHALARSQLNEKYDIDRFAKGKCNSMAYLAANRFVESPAELNNMLLLYGPPSCGKTHLLQGIALLLQEREPGGNVVYTSGEKFASQFVWALRNKKLADFRSTFREADWLIVDNIDMLQTKRAAQEEFLHTLDHVLNSGHRIVGAASDHPAQLKLRKRLEGRLLSGMVAGLKLPDKATRVEILRKLSRDVAEPTRKAFSQRVYDHLAEKFSGNVRDLVGAFVKLAAYVSLLSGKGPATRLTLRGVEKALADLGDNRPAQVTLADICEQTAEFFGLSASAILSKSRRKSVALPRQICMYLATCLTSCTLKEIGKHFGGRSHSAVSSARKRVTQLTAVDRAIGDSVARIEAALKTMRM